jgi:predicted O-methyltransferase YrrM
MDAVRRKELARYVAGLFAPEDEILIELRREMAEAELPDIYIDPEEGRLLQVLLKAVNARLVVELGTLGGYSAIWMARALPEDGQLVTVEKEPARAELARRFLDRAGLGEHVDVLEGVAADLLDDVAARGPFDVAFIDADKENYPLYLEWCLANVRPGGLIIADNAFKGGQVLESVPTDAGVAGIKEFNRRLAEDPLLTSIVVPTRDGVAIAVVNRS